MTSEPRYDERLPAAALRPWVRTSWIQHAGAAPYLQRNIPTGGMELRYILGGELTLLGPLTSVREEMLPPHTTLVGLRFWPGAPVAGDLPAVHLTDLVVPPREIWGPPGRELEDELAATSDPEIALTRLTDYARRLLAGFERRPLIASVVEALMPWRPLDVSAVALSHELSGSQLRRRVLDAVGMPPKVLQRTLRFQGYVALAQAAAATEPMFRIAEAGALAGYADQPHLTRECVRLSGRTPTALLGPRPDLCGCGHDHSASYVPFLRGRAFRSIAADRSLLPSIA